MKSVTIDLGILYYNIHTILYERNLNALTIIFLDSLLLLSLLFIKIEMPHVGFLIFLEHRPNLQYYMSLFSGLTEEVQKTTLFRCIDYLDLRSWTKYSTLRQSFDLPLSQYYYSSYITKLLIMLSKPNHLIDVFARTYFRLVIPNYIPIPWVIFKLEYLKIHHVSSNYIPPKTLNDFFKNYYIEMHNCNK